MHHEIASDRARSRPARAIGPLGTAARLAMGATMLSLGGFLDPDGVDWAALALGAVAFPAGLGLVQRLRLAFVPAPLRATGPVAFVLNLVALGVLLVLPWTGDPTFVFLGLSMLLAAWRGYAGCESLAVSNWLLRRDDQVGCMLFGPLDELEARVRDRGRGESALLPGLLVLKFAGCMALAVLLIVGW